MAQTFNDFVAECVAFPYSKENYDLMKEAAEIDMMAQYLENQAFYAENVAEATVAYTESYFMESASDEQIQAITESFGEKVKAFGKKISDGIKKIVDKIIRFFQTIGAKLSKTSQDGIKLYKDLKAANITPEQYEALGKRLISLANSSGLKIYKQQPFAVDLGVRGSVTLQYLKYYQVAFSNTSVKLGLEDSDDVVDANTLTKILKKFSTDSQKHDFDSTVKLIESARTEGARNGVEVFANDKKLEKVIKALEDIKGKLGSMEIEAVENEINNGMKDVSKMRAAWAMINTTVGATLKQYGGYMKYRQRAHEEVARFIKGGKVEEAESAEA